MPSKSPPKAEVSRRRDWERDYSSTDFWKLPWETGSPEGELVRLIQEGKVAKGRALDAGCGAGTNAVYLATVGFEVTGVDISRSALRIARARIKEAGARARLLLLDVLHLGFGPKSFDFAFDRGCFHHVPPELRPRYVRSIRRVLSDKGRFHLICFSDSNPGHEENRFSLRKINYYFGKQFEVLEARETSAIQPNDGERVFLRSVLMKKNQKSMLT